MSMFCFFANHYIQSASYENPSYHICSFYTEGNEDHSYNIYLYTTCKPQPLYNTAVEIQNRNVSVKQPCHIQTKIYRLYRKMSFSYIIYTFWGSIYKPCYIQNRVITNSVIKRLWCIIMFWVNRRIILVCEYL